ncbi:MAG: ABC transporter ATP-binding protein [Oscillospiraceae bacterium]
MAKLAKYLKPFIALIIAAVALLFVQAYTDLSLPNYMSDIVNIGLQQGGITTSVPEKAKASTLGGFLSVIDENDSKLVLSAYEADGEYLILKKNLDEETLSKLSRIFEKTSTALIKTMQSLAPDSGEMTEETASDVTFESIMPMIQNLPPEEIQKAFDNAEKVDDMILEQTGIAMTKKLYEDAGIDVNKIQSSYILKTGLMMLLMTLIGMVSTILVGLIASTVAAKTAQNIRHDVFKKVESFSSNEFDKFSTSSLITRTTNDITQISMLILMGMRMIIYAPIIGVGGSIMAIKNGPSISWIIVLACALLIGIILVIYLLAMPKFKIVQKLIDKLNRVSRENLSGIMAVRAFGNQEFEKDRFDKANSELTDTNLFVNRVMAFMMPAMMFIMNLATILIVWVGADKISQSQMQVGNMMAFMQYAMQIIMAFLMISMMFIMIPRAAVSGERIAEVLETKPTILDPENAKDFEANTKRTVEFKNVSFRYNGAEENVLENISFTAKPGETTAIIGSTGSGKSTLINLIPRFYDATEGEILINGINIKDVAQNNLHNQIGFIPQKGVLHSGTIASNLRYGKEDATDEEVQKAAEIAQAMEFISNPDVGFDKEISEGGTNVSGGQKQRLSIARALVKKPPIYIFDDSFSALDFKTDAALRRALKNYTGDSTVLIVAQRVSTIMNAEQIIVLDEGKIVGLGTHKELLKSCPTYFDIASSQLSKEEM